jgi:hypothetical protein
MQMTKYCFNKVTTGLIAAFLLVSIISFTDQANAQMQPGMPSMITGKYTNSDFGVQMTFPNGWRAMETKTSTGASVSAFQQDQELSNGGSTSASVISLTMMTKPTTVYTDPNIPTDPKVKCDVISSDNTNINGMSATVTVTQCTGPDGDIKMKGYSFQTDKNLIYANYMAMPSSLYDGNVAIFDSALNTLQITNTIGAPSAPQPSSPTTTENTTSSSAVPEFPIHVIIVFAVVMSMVAIFGKTKLSGFNIK